MYGLLERDFKFIFEAISGYPEIEEVIIFSKYSFLPRCSYTFIFIFPLYFSFSYYIID